MGDPFSANRCFAFGYFLPVNSKKADGRNQAAVAVGEMTGAPPGRPGGKAKLIGTSSNWSPAARITSPVSLILMSSACGMAELNVPERVFCLASGTDWVKARVTHSTVQHLLVEELVELGLGAVGHGVAGGSRAIIKS